MAIGSPLTTIARFVAVSFVAQPSVAVQAFESRRRLSYRKH